LLFAGVVCAAAATGAGLLAAPATQRRAPAPPTGPEADFFTCAGWTRSRTASEPDTRLGGRYDGFLAGVANGIVTGMVSDPGGSFERTVAGEKVDMGEMDSFYARGLVQALGTPALLVQAFTTTCADERNGALTLDDLTVVALVEIGGMRTATIDQALEVLRRGGPKARADMLALLRGK